MHLRPALLLIALVLAGCGGGSPDAEQVVRAWSDALNASDYEAAAALFADGAEIVQGPNAIPLRTQADARRFNEALPCSGRIVHVERNGDSATATFVLGNRPDSACDAPGAGAKLLVRVRDGKIVLWHQLESDAPSSEQV